ncbi:MULTISPECIES: molybdate ABC transporter permease subunit [Hydrocarboniphaga]|uniref:Molybdenum transport system permease n=1 Tax=Hydrocarboniphaga effusa AP103 TaxID=1172194 RepID=I7ZAX6_9GAMM|nr:MULTISPECIES: molybdate ABC transporter permease subunit [Hydrocarboniphaga]EIT68989.1 molybdate ABC transporter permease protein [Hydrocarboniphaga effusa AP103]MDZ4081131.1 molybdate ABC transporter permease subunit [Hydrocarboniphaga sp.]
MALTPEEWQAVWLSAKVAAFATLLCLPLGIALSWLMARREFFGKALIETLIQLPMVLPPVVPGYLLLMLLGTRGPLGSWLQQHFGIVFAFDWKGAVLASAVIAFPLMVQPVRLAFRMIDTRLEQAATTLGATPLRSFFTITLPLALPGIVIGAVLCFSRSLGEFGATMAFVGNIPGQTRTLPLAIYSYSHLPDGEAAAARLVLLSIALAVCALLASHWIGRRAEHLIGDARTPHA